MAPDAWATIHVKPHIACISCLLCLFAAEAVVAPIFIFASKPFRWLHHSAYVAHMFFFYTSFCALWRGGPRSGDTLLLRGCVYISISTYIAVVLTLLLGPIEACPFRSRLVTLTVNAVFLWLTALASFCGSWTPDLPKHPYRCAYPLLTCMQSAAPRVKYLQIFFFLRCSADFRCSLNICHGCHPGKRGLIPLT